MQKRLEKLDTELQETKEAIKAVVETDENEIKKAAGFKNSTMKKTNPLESN